MSAALPCHKLIFQFGGHLLKFFPISKHVSGLWKPYFFQYGNVLGMRLSSAVLLVLLPALHSIFLVRFVTSAASLAFVATKALLLVVSVTIADVS